MNELEIYLKNRLIEFEVLDYDYILIDDKIYQVLGKNGGENIFNQDFEFSAYEVVEGGEIDGWIYNFCGRWYIQKYESTENDFLELKNIGKISTTLPTKSFLGIHSGMELMNGIGLYQDWINKAKFLGAETLGICEKNTLSGVLDFQKVCTSNGIKPIIGMTINAKNKDKTFELKLYAKDFQGWTNLLKINHLINVENVKAIDIELLGNNRDGLFIIADPKSMEFDSRFDAIDFFQLDTVNFVEEEKDSWYMDNLEKFILSDLDPISIVDAYHTEKEEYEIRECLWIQNKAFHEKTTNQFFKSSDEYASELINMFQSDCKAWVSIYKVATKNEEELIEQCNFEYDLNTRHLPKYKMTKEESENFSTNEELFIHLLMKGFKERNIEDDGRYIERLKTEIEVLKMGDVIDYFLTLYDIIQYAKGKEMLTGIGRGSAGGSLVAYLLDIIQIDPIEFDLLFERFLNSGRMGEFKDRPSFILKDQEGNSIELPEGTVVKLKRGGKEIFQFIHEIKLGDEIIKY